MRSFVLDSYALLVFLNREPGSDRVRAILEEAQAEKVKLPMSAINWGEVLYSIGRKDGRGGMRFIEERIRNSAIEIILPTFEHVRTAAEFKMWGGASYADCFAGALAWELDIPVLTGDLEFQNLEKHGVKIEWLPKNR
jgi:PIN domain nuclease of toxin-antitoxin system